MRSFFKKLGPGLLFAGAAIGVSHLVQSTRAGADFGFGLLWALLLVNLFKYPFFQYGPRYALATGENLLQGYAKLGRPVLVAYFILSCATMFTIQTAVTVVSAGLAAHIFGLSNDVVLWSLIITIVCLLILLLGRYGLLDRLMKIIIILLTLSTVTAVVLIFNKENTGYDFTPFLPQNAVQLSFLVAFMGWMPAPLDISIWHSLWALEKKKSLPSYGSKSAIFDFNVGYAGIIVLAILFVSLGAMVMHQSGETFSNSALVFSSQLIQLYTNGMGQWAALIIGVAAFTTMFSTTLTTLDASPRAMTAASRILLKKTLKKGYLFWILILAAGTLIILLFFQSGMKTLIDIATILSFVTAPFYALANFVLISSKHTPKDHRPGKALKTLSWAGILFLTGFALYYLIYRFA